MKKRVFGRYLSRGGGARKALYVSLIRALVLNGKIETSKAKAKSIVSEIEKLVTQALRGNLNKTLSFFRNDRKINSEFNILVRQFSRTSGFTRLTNLPRRKGDLAEMVRIEWVDNIVKEGKVVAGKDKKEEAEKAKKGEVKPRKKSKKVSTK